MGSVSSTNVMASIGLSGKVRVKEIIKLALIGKFHDARIKLLELMQVYGMSESDFLRYANQEAYDLKLDRPDEFAAFDGRVRLPVSYGCPSRNTVGVATCPIRQAWSQSKVNYHHH